MNALSSLIFRTGIAIVFAVSLFIVGHASFVSAQPVSHTTLASPIVLPDNVNNGDIVSYNVKTGSYHKADVPEDEAMFGIVVDDPVLLMMSGDVPAGARPVVRFGEATVNVSTLNGEVRAGDIVTTSSIPGIGERASLDPISSYVLGYALANMTYAEDTAPITVDGKEVKFGTVPVTLRIGPWLKNLDEEIQVLAAQASSTAATVAAQQQSSGDNTNTTNPFKVFRYVLGALVAIGTVVIALRKFGDMFGQSVISVGRNPLARSQIRSIILWNTVIILIVSAVGLAISAAIIVIP